MYIMMNCTIYRYLCIIIVFYGLYTPTQSCYSGCISFLLYKIIITVVVEFLLLPQTLVIYIHTGKLKIKNVTECVSIIPYIVHTIYIYLYLLYLYNTVRLIRACTPEVYVLCNKQITFTRKKIICLCVY